MWEVEFTDAFETWWESLAADEQESVAASVGLIELLGPQLARPHSDTVKGSKHSNMRTNCTMNTWKP